MSHIERLRAVAEAANGPDSTVGGSKVAMALLDEVERLRAWKSEALPVMAGLQEVGHALGLPLGAQITGREGFEAAERLRAKVARAEALAEEWTSATCQTDGAPCSWHRVSGECATELRAALSDAQDEGGTGGRRVAEGPGESTTGGGK